MQWLLDWMWVVTSIGDFDILALIILVTALMFALHRQWKPLTCLLTSAVLVNILTIMTKNYFERARPMLDGVSVGGYSFPSGHTTGAFVVFGIVAWVFLNEVENKKVKYLGVTLAVVIGSLVGISRVYLGAHWASDVYGGVLVAAGIMLVITSLINYVADHMAS